MSSVLLWSGWSPSSLGLTALAGLLATYYWTWSRSRFVRLVDALPGPKPLPVLGNLFHFANFSFGEMMATTARDNPIYKLWISFYPLVFISHPELLKPILSSNKNLTRTQEYNFVFPEDTLIVLTDEPWRKRRRLLNPAFHFQILHGFIDSFNDISIDCISKMEHMMGNIKCKEMDVFPIMSQLVLEILCETSLGGKVWSADETTDCIKAHKKMEFIFTQRAIYKPWLRIDFVFKWTSLYRQQLQIVSAGEVSIDKVIKTRREMLRQEAEKNSSLFELNNNIGEDDKRPRRKLAFLDLVLMASEENSDFNDEILRNEVRNFMAAGFDTTSLVFTWFLYLMAKHPEHQKLVVEELDLIFGDSDRPVTDQDLVELKYLECCIKETLRLYPPLPTISRYLTEEVQTGDYTLPKGVTVCMNIYAAHHNPEFFPDPESFKPERFLPENSVDRHPYAFIPFSAGLRNCIAQKYAMIELKVCLANILRKLNFSLSDPSGPLETPIFQISLKPNNGECFLIVSKRIS